MTSKKPPELGSIQSFTPAGLHSDEHQSFIPSPPLRPRARCSCCGSEEDDPGGSLPEGYVPNASKFDAICRTLRWRSRIAIMAATVIFCMLLMCAIVWLVEGPSYQNARFARDEILDGSGSTAAAPLFVQLQAAYKYSNMVYNLSDSLAGIATLELSQTNATPALVSSYSISDFSGLPQVDLGEDSVAFAYYPLGVGMVSVVYTPSFFVTDAKKQLPLRLSREALVGIYLGAITSWQDPQIQETNPSIAFPNASILPLHREDPGSGTSFWFQNLLCQFSATNLLHKWPFCPPVPGLAPRWPVPNPFFPGTVDSNEAMLAVSIRYPASVGGLATIYLDNDLGLHAAALQTADPTAFVSPGMAALQASIDVLDLNDTWVAADQPMLRQCEACYPAIIPAFFGFASSEIEQCTTAGSVISGFLRDYFLNVQSKHSTYRKILQANYYAAFNGTVSGAFLDELTSSGSCVIAAISIWTLLLGTGLLTFFVCTLLLIALVYLKRHDWISAGDAGAQQPPLSDAESMPLIYKHALQNISVDGMEVQLFNIVGTGSSSVVYRARWNGTLVAVKKIKLRHKLSDDISQEVVLMTQLRHPNILQIYGTVADTEYFMVIVEWCPFGSLDRQLLSRPSPLELSLRRRIALDIARGMAYLHSRNPPIIHRDLKPENILLMSDWTAKISDFGLSIFYDSAQRYSACGTPQFTPPEMIQGTVQVSTACDVYSFGIMLWEIVSLSSIYPKMPPEVVLKKVAAGMRPPLTKKIPPILGSIMAACWDQDPARRPSFADILTLLNSKQVRRECTAFIPSSSSSSSSTSSKSKITHNT